MNSLSDFWARISDGMALNELWAQLRDETESSYRLYARDAALTPAAGAPPIPYRQRHREHRRWFGRFLWAIVRKMSPARRIVLLLALVLLALPQMAFLGILLLLALLGLEIADRVAMKRDLEIAREIQLWLLPAAAPEIVGAAVAFLNRPANTVSGDFYDAFYRDREAKLLLAVADVAGKGIPAAMVMATFQASLRTLAAETLSLSDVTLALNRYACGHSAGGTRFTTAFLAEYDPVTRRLRYCNAGHNPPLLRRAGGAIEKLDRGGVPLGILAEADFECAEVALQPDDALVIFSDGMTESFNPAGEDYGEARLMAALHASAGLSAPALLAALADDCARFRAGARPSDDLTCLVLRVNGSVRG